MIKLELFKQWLELSRYCDKVTVEEWENGLRLFDKEKQSFFETELSIFAKAMGLITYYGYCSDKNKIYLRIF